MAGLNIKDPQVHALARRMAARTGQSMTGVIRAALSDWEARLQAAEGRADAAELLALAQAVTAGIGGAKGAGQGAPDSGVPDHGALFYDDAGLPR